MLDADQLRLGLPGQSEVRLSRSMENALGHGYSVAVRDGDRLDSEHAPFRRGSRAPGDVDEALRVAARRAGGVAMGCNCRFDAGRCAAVAGDLVGAAVLQVDLPAGRADDPGLLAGDPEQMG